MHSELWRWMSSVTPQTVKQFYHAAVDVYLAPWFWIALGCILVAERLWPVVPRKRAVPASMVEDSFWLNVELAMRAMIVPFVAAICFVVWQWATGGFKVAWLNQLPGFAKIAISLLIWDFLSYFNHWVRHRFWPLWHFHSIHHSQRDLNPLSANRNHLVEYIVVEPLVFIPMFALQLTPFEMMGTGAAIGWLTRLNHSNIRTNLGPLGLVFVSPQHHRIHHSIELAHRDKHFGLILTVWDRLFGTFVPDRTVYPITGVEDVNFPPPASANPVAWAGFLFQQVIHPFKQIAMDVRRPVEPAVPEVAQSQSRAESL